MDKALRLLAVVLHKALRIFYYIRVACVWLWQHIITPPFKFLYAYRFIEISALVILALYLGVSLLALLFPKQIIPVSIACASLTLFLFALMFGVAMDRIAETIGTTFMGLVHLRQALDRWINTCRDAIQEERKLNMELQKLNARKLEDKGD